MSAPDSPVIIGGDPKEEIWGVVAHRAGVWKPLIPRFFPRPMSSYAEVIETVMLRARIDAGFRERFAGWHIAGCRVDGQVSL